MDGWITRPSVVQSLVRSIEHSTYRGCFVATVGFYIFFKIFWSILNELWGFQPILMVLAVSARCFKLVWCRNQAKIRSRDDFWTFWDAILCAETFLLITYVFKTKYSKRHRWAPIDLRRGVHLKHQNLISKLANFREKTSRVPDYFTLCLPDSTLTVNMHRECVRKTSFEKCFTTH